MDTPSSATIRSGEDALARAFAANELWAFETAYAEYRRIMYGAAYGVLHDAHAAEDCVHDVMVRLWRGGNPYRAARGSLEAFLAVCVRNEALSRRRKEANRLRIVRDSAASGGEPVETAIAASVDVHRAMSELSESQQRALSLAYFDGLRYDEIAQRCGEPVGTIKSRLSSALKALRRKLAVEESV